MLLIGRRAGAVNEFRLLGLPRHQPLVPGGHGAAVLAAGLQQIVCGRLRQRLKTNSRGHLAGGLEASFSFFSFSSNFFRISRAWAAK
jgi:hypothetical protein